jgi:hypothetical protein
VLVRGALVSCGGLVADERRVEAKVSVLVGCRPNCGIGRAGSGRPLPEPTADLGTLSVRGAKTSGADPIQNSALRKPISTATLAVLKFRGLWQRGP